MRGMSTALIVVVIVIVIVVVAAVALIARTARRRSRLQRQFGPEYDRTVEASGKRSEAERELLNRQDRIEDMDIRPLDPAARDTYHAEWARVQERFVDTPEDALSDADQLVRRVMADRGYETQGYQQRVADLSVEHARTLEHYRTAHDISARAANKEASTEELRQAMIHYRALFEDLLGGSPGGTGRATTETEGDPQYRTAADHPGTPREG
jgi:hypothetical protein